MQKSSTHPSTYDGGGSRGLGSVGPVLGLLALGLAAASCSSDSGSTDEVAPGAMPAGSTSPSAMVGTGTTDSSGTDSTTAPGSDTTTAAGTDGTTDATGTSGQGPATDATGDTATGDVSTMQDDGPPNVNTEETVAPDTVVDVDGQTLDCGQLERPPTPLRRLTRFEYNNAVHDLLGTSLTPAEDFPPDEVADGFTNNALVLTVSSLHAEKYMQAAETLAAEAVSNLGNYVTCDPAAIGEEECAREFATSFARRAYRRAPEPEDIDALMTAYAAGAATSFERGIEVMIRAVLQSPHFLYRIEFTGTETPGVGMVRLNGYETASRLSFLLWGSIPTEELLTLAEDGGLDTPEQVASQARAMLQDPKARPAVTQFYHQWLGLTRLEITGKDPATFPLWTDEMRAAMAAENATFVESVVFGQTPTLSALLTQPIGLPQGPLADLYGIAPSDTPVTLPDEQQRAGVLTSPAFLAVQAHPDQTSPVLRGKFIRAKMMCTPPEPPPPDLAITVPTVDEDSTARERFSAHSQDAVCAGCHTLMDPLGFAFESFDSIGQFRTMEAGQPVDTTGEMVASEDMDGPFANASELAAKLAGSAQVRGCVATQWYKYAMGRGEEAGDSCSLAPLREAFEASGGDLMEMMVALTQTEAFLYRLSVEVTEVSQ